MIVSPSDKFSFGVASFDDSFAEFVELLPPRAKLSLGGVNFGDAGLGVDSFNVDSVGACNLLFSFRGLSTGGESVEDGVFEEDIIAPIAVII
ncbi:Hydroxylamine reductase (modular protein) [Moritella yayanosii]|uniref:Hydroxylamine reductase (Modular protein) n=1 Tax=Moritella yayanosii TaxID=69539 RepID=A0A330LUR5_9GAMM|nr:Hydroxylamine reductase (modular protein) [Moritella yayanosii]